MVIKASTAAEVRQLIDALGGEDDVVREAAVARLSIIGGRAVTRLIATYSARESRVTRIAVLRALEGIGDSRALPVAQRALEEGGDLAVSATSVLRALLDASDSAVAAAALGRLAAIALDRSREQRVRLAAFEALRDLPGGVPEQVMQALAQGPDARARALATSSPRNASALDAIWDDAVGGALPDQPADLRDAAQARAETAPLGTLQSLIDNVRAREGTTAGPQTHRAAWQAVRGALHQALALRGSRVAVYDLRETLEDAQGPLPVTFLAALHAIGDDTCLEPIAAAYTRASDLRWQHQLADAFGAIARRERIGARSAAFKRIAGKWPAVTGMVGTPRK